MNAFVTKSWSANDQAGSNGSYVYITGRVCAYIRSEKQPLGRTL